jgi:hypothetical protein
MLEADQEALAFGVLRHGTDMEHVSVFLRLESEGPRPSWCRTPTQGKALAGQTLASDNEGRAQPYTNLGIANFGFH